MESVDRYRLCERFLWGSKLPEHALFLHKRIEDLITGVRGNANIALLWFQRSTWFFLLILVIGAVLSLFRERLKVNLVGFASALAMLVLAASTSFGWLNQYKAEFAAYFALVRLRDTIETEFVRVVVTERELNDDTVVAWVRDYNTIMKTYAKAITSSFSIPGRDLIGGLGGGS